MGLRFNARCVILTVGTFLGGKIHIGDSHHQGGRARDVAEVVLARALRQGGAGTGLGRDQPEVLLALDQKATNIEHRQLFFLRTKTAVAPHLLKRTEPSGMQKNIERQA